MTQKIPLREPEQRRAARWRRVALDYREAAELHEEAAKAWRRACLLCLVAAATAFLWGLLR